MKRENVLEMVYEPRRLQWAWQEIRRNVGAVGIDGITADAFAGGGGTVAVCPREDQERNIPFST
ncbi:MAG: hypothetical protein ACLP9S_01550 [Syntrophales bacterium]